jgi:cathepsin F
MSQHNKQYDTAEEYERRLHNFVETSKRIVQQNHRSKLLNSTATFGFNKFSDLTLDEFKELLGIKKFKQEKLDVPIAASPVAGPPSHWDWRHRGGITGQKNELQCGSCWAMTVVMAIESAYMIHKGKSNQQALATQQIIDCDTSDGGCNGGMPTTAYDYVVKAAGLETNASYPYLGQDGTCKAKKSLEQDPITGYQLAIPTGSKDEIRMANFLATNQPISTAVDASSWSTYTGGVLMADQCGQNIDHGVQIVGYNGLDKNGYWIIRNMWGADWGEDGFIRLQFGMNTCGLTSLPTAPTLPK